MNDFSSQKLKKKYGREKECKMVSKKRNLLPNETLIRRPDHQN